MKFKLPYQDGITKRVCMKIASLERSNFRRLWKNDQLNLFLEDKKNDFDIISFSGRRDLEEQVLNIYSFLYYVGIPNNWTLYSDGSHASEDIQLLSERFPFLEVKKWDEHNDIAGHNLIKEYLKTCHLAKKLSAILGHAYERQTMYLDSDIVFYGNASVYFDNDLLKDGFWYAPETNWARLDKSKVELKEMFALNSGLLILNKTFNKDLVFEYLENLKMKFGYFSEQSSFDYSFKKQNAGVLDPRQFVISTEDQFDVNMGFDAKKMAMRHYVNPVRHKMWQKGWKWHFKN